MSKNTNRAATAAISNTFSKKEISRYRRLQAEFDQRKGHLAILAEAYPAALAAIDEYAGLYPHEIGLAHGKDALNHAQMLNNDLICVTDSEVMPYAAEAIAAVTAKGDQPGDAVPAEVVQGLQYVRHNLPTMFARIVGIDSALGQSMPSEGGYAASALLMRSALSLAA